MSLRRRAARPTALVIFGALLLAAAVPGCAADTEEGVSGEGQAASTAPGARDRPWEVSSDKGEGYLANVFYAEASENEQVMPLTMEGGRHQIDRLIYPTLGNPNLYEKYDATDSLTVVLRMEQDALAHLAPNTARRVDGSWLQHLALTETAGNEVAIYLVPRSAREAATTIGTALPEGTGAIRVKPSALYVHPIAADMPEAFKKRFTVRAMFDKAAMAQVPAGLYDVRLEVKKDGALVPAAGGGSLYEFQYNAVRVFETAPTAGYSVLNVTDTQVSKGMTFEPKTLAKLQEFVAGVNSSTDPGTVNAAFITFNGDLHNGGSPGGMRSRFVANTYNDEARSILAALKDLNYPIFLTAGNHDGYVSTGQTPTAVAAYESVAGERLRDIVEAAQPKEWPNFSWDAYDAYRQATKDDLGGLHRDVFTGAFVRHARGQTFRTAWQELPRDQRNMVLYDGFHQWQRTYGPLYTSWAFGKNFYVNLNSYELRQHRRSGWGMYTVNYGGGMSQTQLIWLNRQLDQAQADNLDVTLLAHHDPRGGHNGKDFPYYFAQVDYAGMGQSGGNYVSGEYVNPTLCNNLPSWATSNDRALSCLHDGLQEWMRADEEFDCNDEERLADGKCNTALYDPNSTSAERRHPYYSGYDLIHKIVTHSRVRTLLLGHTHYNQLNVAQSGDQLVPDRVVLDGDQGRALATLEVENPVRGFAWAWAKIRGQDTNTKTYDPARLEAHGIIKENDRFVQLLAQAGHSFNRVLEGNKRELVILRLTSNSDMTSQRYNSETMMGYATFAVNKKADVRAYDAPQINEVTFHINRGGQFGTVASVPIDRTVRITNDDAGNPVNSLFTR